jgi:hypothetical protein
MQTFFRQYLTISMRAFAYLAGALLSAPINVFAEHAMPIPYIRWPVFLLLNIVEFEIAGAIISRTYRPHFPATLLSGTSEYDFRLMLEKMFYQLVLFFGFDFVLAVGVSLLGFHAAPVGYWVWGVFGFPAALTHFFGVALLAAGFYDANALRARTQAKITGAVFMLPGIVYIGVVSWLFLKFLSF